MGVAPEDEGFGELADANAGDVGGGVFDVPGFGVGEEGEVFGEAFGGFVRGLGLDFVAVLVDPGLMAFDDFRHFGAIEAYRNDDF